MDAAAVHFPAASSHADGGFMHKIIFGLVLALAIGVPAHCGAHAAPATTADAPAIDKIDPPNWWVDMPSPMLLLHGHGLASTKFGVRNAAVATISIIRQQASANGHWAFLFLDTANAEPTDLTITAQTAAGEAKHAFRLQRRHAPAGRYAGFSESDVLYLIMPDRFADGDPSNDPPASAPGTYDRSSPRAYHGGDLRGIQQHLDYLQQLGVSAVWVTPVYDNSANKNGDVYHGYSATDTYAVDPHLGTLPDLQKLADALHARGMKLVLDTVPNHVGPKHPWVTDEPTPDWFHGTAAHHSEAVGDFSSIVDPHGSEHDRSPPLHGWFANILPDLNQENPLVSTYLIQNAEWWIESAGLDGLRIDTFPYVGRAFWHDFHSQLKALYPQLTTVGEVFNQDPTVVSYFAGGQAHAGVDTGLYTPFDFPTYFALRACLIHGEPMTRLAAVLRQDSLYPFPERLVPFEGNHDTKRFLSESGATAAELKLAFGVLATLRGMPEIYSGDEIAMTGGEDPDNRRDFPGGFPGDPHNAFSASGRTADQAAMHDWVTKLLQLRREHPALVGGEQQELLANDSVLAYARIARGGGCSERLLVAVNDGAKPQTIHISLQQTALEGAQRFKDLLQGDESINAANQQLTLQLAPQSLSILQGKDN
jgi:glycosidase